MVSYQVLTSLCFLITVALAGRVNFVAFYEEGQHSKESYRNVPTDKLPMIATYAGLWSGDRYYGSIHKKTAWVTTRVPVATSEQAEAELVAMEQMVIQHLYDRGPPAGGGSGSV